MQLVMEMKKEFPIKGPIQNILLHGHEVLCLRTRNRRDLVAKMKLIPNKAVIEGKKMVFLDDSIVRGTQLKDNTIDLRKSGAAEVHMRIACPPLLFACDFLNFSESRSIT